MINLSKIKISDKVSAWINCVNNIIDTIKLAVAPTVNDEGELVGGNDGYLSKEDKKKIDDFEKNFVTSNGNSGVTATWKQAKFVEDASFFITIESPDVMLVNTSGTCEIDIISANHEEYSEKTLYVTALENTNLTITGITDTIDFGTKGDTLFLKIYFVAGRVMTSVINI